MLYFDLLPMVRRPDMGVGGECEVYLLQPSLQEASMPASELDTGGEYEAHSQQSSSHKASMPVNELETGGDHEVKLHQSSIQKDSMPANESEDAVMTDQAPIGEQDQAQTSGGTSELQVVIFRSLRSADRLQQKTVKDGKPSIKGHGMTADDSVVRLQDCQNELKDNTAKLAASKKDLKKIKGQLHSKKKDLTACKRKLKASKGSGRDLKAKIKSLQDSLTVAQENLTKCKDDLFSLQTMTRIPDSLILDSFESLSQQIVQWIDAEVATFEKAHPEAKPDHVFSLGEDKFATAFLRDHPSAGEHLARFLIHRFSLVNVFWKTVSFFGLPEETAQLLWNAELRMAELDPPRGT